jgi:hypothetical protein
VRRITAEPRGLALQSRHRGVGDRLLRGQIQDAADDGHARFQLQVERRSQGHIGSMGRRETRRLDAKDEGSAGQPVDAKGTGCIRLDEDRLRHVGALSSRTHALLRRHRYRADRSRRDRLTVGSGDLSRDRLDGGGLRRARCGLSGGGSGQAGIGRHDDDVCDDTGGQGEWRKSHAGDLLVSEPTRYTRGPRPWTIVWVAHPASPDRTTASPP